MTHSAPNDALGALADVLGDDATREIVRLFLDDFPEAYRRLGQAPRDEQVRIVHGLKSSALHMGARQLSERVAGIEERLARRGLDLEPGDLPGLQADFDEVAPTLRRYAAGAPTT